MRFHSGLGYLVAPVAALGFLIPILLEGWVALYYGATVSPWFVTSLIATLPVFGLLRLDSILKRLSPTKRGVDRITGQEIDIVQRHTFMSLSVKRCAYAWIVLAVCLGLANLLCTA